MMNPKICSSEVSLFRELLNTVILEGLGISLEDAEELYTITGEWAGGTMSLRSMTILVDPFKQLSMVQLWSA